MAIDLCGQRFGRLVVVCKDGVYTSPSGYTKPKWKCVCDCGKTVIVRGSSLKQQCNNKRTNHYITYKNITKSMSSWADELGINYNTLRSKIRNGWKPEKALFTPIDRRCTSE